MSVSAPVTSATLAKAGFASPRQLTGWASSDALLAACGGEVATRDDVLRVCGKTPSPDDALQLFVLMAEDCDAVAELGPIISGARGPEAQHGLAMLCGTSRVLGEYLLAHPGAWRDVGAVSDAAQMRARLLACVDTDDEVGAWDALRREYYRLMIPIVVDDVTSSDPASRIAAVGAAMSALAGASLDAALDIASRAIGADQCRLAIIAFGKAGADELNYISDVDVMFCYAPRDGASTDDAYAQATALATAVMKGCSATTLAGTLWPVDAGLRPEGGAGPLVRTLAGYEDYYDRWAHTWEFQALLKGNAVAGDAELGRAFIDMVEPLVWNASTRPDFVAEVQAMRRRVEQSLDPADRERAIKLGPGGLRDVEFSVQLLQLVHGRVDESLRARDTLGALEALVAGGYVGRDAGKHLRERYEFLRLLEHREQLYRMRRSHMLPRADKDMRRLARGVGCGDADGLARKWAHTRVTVRRFHENLFYRPLLDAVSSLSADELRLSEDAARDRLRALGFVDATSALTHLRALTRGVSRRAQIQRHLAPALMGWLGRSADPDAALLSFRRISDALTGVPWFLGLLRDYSAVAERLGWLLGAGAYPTKLLEAHPSAIRWLADDAELTARTREAIKDDMAGADATDLTSRIAQIRALRQHEVTRIALAHLLGLIDNAGSAAALTDATAAALDASLDAVCEFVAPDHGLSPGDVRVGLIGMGRFGGAEMGYASDADVMCVHDPGNEDPKVATSYATAVMKALRATLRTPGAAHQVEIDTALRPEGSSGPPSRSVESYVAYYSRWSSAWESQALLRAAPMAGDMHMMEPVLEAADALRYPPGGPSEQAMREMRRLKARMEAERLPRGVSADRHLKLGPGGLSDVEWTIQLLQLQHGHDVAGLRTPSTLPALEAATTAGLLKTDDADVLRAAWQFASRARNAVTLWCGKGGDVLPSDPRDIEGVARLMGYSPGRSQDFISDAKRHRRRCRAVTERVFFG